jgi:tetratricopeptide (TPR) repeat protein
MVEAWLKLGEVRSRAGRHAAAADAFRQAVARCHPPAADMLLALGQAELAAGGLEEAEKAARAAEAGSPAHARVLRAEVLVRRGDHAGALRALDGTPPSVFKAEFVRADALARQGRAAEAEAAYRRHIAAFPKHLQSYANLAVLAFVQGRRGEVDAILEQMAGAAPGAEAYRVAEKTMAAFADRRAAAAWRRRAAQAPR